MHFASPPLSFVVGEMDAHGVYSVGYMEARRSSSADWRGRSLAAIVAIL